MSAASIPQVPSGFVALVGRPNAGKSTLTNALVGEKVAIVSDKPQTTRHRLRAIVDTGDAQVVLIDTPGLHKPKDALGEELNRSALMALSDVDVACMVVDSSAPVGGGDRWVGAHIAKSSAKKVLDRGSVAFVGNVREVASRDRVEQFDGKVGRAAIARAADVCVGRFFLSKLDQVLYVLRRRGLAGDGRLHAGHRHLIRESIGRELAASVRRASVTGMSQRQTKRMALRLPVSIAVAQP